MVAIGFRSGQARARPARKSAIANDILFHPVDRDAQQETIRADIQTAAATGRQTADQTQREAQPQQRSVGPVALRRIARIEQMRLVHAAQRRRAIDRQHQLTDINVWASGQANAPWVRDLWQIRDMAARLILGSPGFDLNNVYGSTASATAVGYCRFGPGNRLEDAATPLEPSPNIHRHRLIVHWYYKTTT